MRRNGSRLSAEASRLLADSRHLAKTGTEEAKSFLREKPLLYTFGGIALGVLIGMFFRRS